MKNELGEIISPKIKAHASWCCPRTALRQTGEWPTLETTKGQRKKAIGMNEEFKNLESSRPNSEMQIQKIIANTKDNSQFESHCKVQVPAPGLAGVLV